MATPMDMLQSMRDDFQRSFNKLLEDNQRMLEGFNNLRKILQEKIQDVKQASPAQEESTYSGSLSSRHTRKSKRNATYVQLLKQKFGPTTVNDHACIFSYRDQKVCILKSYFLTKFGIQVYWYV